MSFTLHPQLDSDCQILGRFTLSLLLLMNDANYPWFILVPQREQISELYQLDREDQQQLLLESMLLSQGLASTFKADKLNVAALGNVVPQLHVHHIVRYRTDLAWPKPVWGIHPAKPYTSEAIQQIKQKISAALGSEFSLL